jgi:hypothetical protein
MFRVDSAAGQISDAGECGRQEKDEAATDAKTDHAGQWLVLGFRSRDVKVAFCLEIFHHIFSPFLSPRLNAVETAW